MKTSKLKDQKLRSVNTYFWDDDYIQKLDPSQKLLFLYLLTNPLTNLIGVYEISLRRIGFDTGFDKDTLANMLNRFAADRKIYYESNYIIFANFLKNQRFNANMQKGADQRIDLLPDEIKRFILGKDLKGFETIRNPSESFGIVRKDEDEDEDEGEDEVGSIRNYSDFLDLSKHINPDDLNDDEKLARINSIHNELKQSGNWQTDLQRLFNTSPAETWHMVKLFLDEIKAKDDFYKPLAEIKRHCISWIRRYKPAMAKN